MGKREPASPFKMAIGLFLLAVGYLWIAFGVKDVQANVKVSMIWLTGMYMMHSMGELCLSPIGLSLVGKLSPKRFSSLLYGVFFLSNASGYALGGTLGSILPATGDKFNKAKELGIPTKIEPELVEFLMQLKLNELVPPKLYAAVAEVLAWAYELDGKTLERPVKE